MKEQREGGREGKSTDEDYGREKEGEAEKKTLQGPLPWGNGPSAVLGGVCKGYRGIGVFGFSRYSPAALTHHKDSGIQNDSPAFGLK